MGENGGGNRGMERMWEGDNVGRGYQVLYLFSCSVWRKGTNLGRHRTCNSVGETLASLRVDTVILCIYLRLSACSSHKVEGQKAFLQICFPLEFISPQVYRWRNGLTHGEVVKFGQEFPGPSKFN